MIDIKDISWKVSINEWDDNAEYTHAYINDIELLMIVNIDNVYKIFGCDDKILNFVGNQGYDKFGSFNTLEEAKIKSEEIIKPNVINYINKFIKQ